MVDFFCRQERTFGLGNFINCTPTLKALSDYYGEPIPVLFESIGDAFIDCQFIRHIKEPEGKELFGSYTINSHEPDWKFIYQKVQSDLNINLNGVPKAHIDNCEEQFIQQSDHIAILRGCFSNIPHKVLAKDPGDDIYIKIIRFLHTHSALKTVFVGTKDDYLRAKFTFKITGRNLLWEKTTIREAIALVNNSKYVIGNDTGLMHAAAALNKRSFCMWEKTNFRKNQTRGQITYSLNNHFTNFQKWISGLI